MDKDFGFLKVAAASPKLQVANCIFNVKEIVTCLEHANVQGVKVITFPELCITGYTCGDLFFQQTLLDQAINGLGDILKASENMDVITIVGLPLAVNNMLYNVAVVVHHGNIEGIVPKTFLPNYNEFYEGRWFSSGVNLPYNCTIDLLGQTNIPVGSSNLFYVDTKYKFSIELCEDLWSVIPPSSYHSLMGADIIFNLSASNDVVGKYDYRKSLVVQQSARCIAGYVYASASTGESSTDLAFAGNCFIVENGSLLSENLHRFSTDNQLIINDIDVEKLRQDRLKNKSFAFNNTILNEDIKKSYFHKTINVENTVTTNKLDRKITCSPFLTNDEIVNNKICRELVDIQVAGLQKRLLATGIKSCVIGVSGGLDSTLALLSMIEVYKKTNLDLSNIYAITMPGFGTSDRTYNNALLLMKELGVTMIEIPIGNAVHQHFKDINHDPNIHDVTYENAQARERTQILMDYANKVNGLVIGTGDLSELALGWCTYNGDQMSMYGLNAGVPKTLVRSVVRWFANVIYTGKVSESLLDVVNTPVSPELLPTDIKGEIAQKTEDNVGPYELHDFFIFYMLRYGFSPSKIMFLASNAFNEQYDKATILKWLKVFYRRFFTQQFKRSCMPDGPKVGSISLSPRGDWRMPSDASMYIWMQEIERITL